MKYFAQIIILLVFFFTSVAQIEVIPTNTGKYLTQLSVIKNNVVITGREDFMTKSLDACNTLTLCVLPGPFGYQNYLHRVDSNLQYLLSASLPANNSKIFKSTDGGNSWSLKLDSSNLTLQSIKFFDRLEGIGFGMFGEVARTKNGGDGWMPSVVPSLPTIITAVQIFGDSTICLGGIDGSTASFFVSRDRGNTWPVGGGFPYSQPTGFCFLSEDTILGISSHGNMYPLYPSAYFTKTFNGGLTWKNLALDNFAYHGIYFKNAKEGYIAGMNNLSEGIILKTTDLGETWETFNTHLTSQLSQIKFLSDSIALVSGSNGVLFKWNSKQAIFTGIKENALKELNFRIFPNPVKDKLSFQYKSSKKIKVNLSISTLLGQVVYSKDQMNLEEELEVDFLKPGVYFVRIDIDKARRIIRFIKE